MNEEILQVLKNINDNLANINETLILATEALGEMVNNTENLDSRLSDIDMGINNISHEMAPVLYKGLSKITEAIQYK